MSRVEEISEVDKAAILESRSSPISPIPDGLLDVLTAAEILDWLACLQSENGVD